MAVVDNSYDLRVRKHGSSKRYLARSLCSSADLDLAVVEVVEDADEFWGGEVQPVSWAEALPELQARVHVIGFPTGGSTVCVTEGVVSRVDCRNFNLSNCPKHCPGDLLVVQAR